MKNYALILIFTSLVSLSANAQKVKIGTFLIPRYVQSKSSGEFVELIEALAKKSGVDIEIVLLPPKRAYEELNDGTIKGLFPVVESRGLSAYEVITEFYMKEVVLFERVGHDYKVLKKPRVCITKGYTYPDKYIDKKGWKRVVVNSDETCLSLLEKKRVDIFLGEIVTVKDSISRLGLLKKIKFNEYSPISSDRVTLAFLKGKEGRKLSEKFDNALKEIMMDRTYERIFSSGAEKIGK